jgi:hypothetical protein
LPAEHPEDPLDPQWILRELLDRERANFLAAYREALDGARDPAGWGHLRRVLPTVSYRPYLESSALRQMGGLPEQVEAAKLSTSCHKSLL